MTSLHHNLIVTGLCLIIGLQLTYQQTVFQQQLQDVNFEPGRFGNMEVTVIPGIPDAGQWFKDGVQLFDIPGKLQISSTGQLRQLVIFSLIMSDTGRYTFTVNGQSTSAYLTVGDVVVGVWGEWTQWIGPPCPVTCGPTAMHNASRSRTCSFANSCSGVGSQSAFRSCGPACGPVNGNWGTWSQWSVPSCPATCGPTARRDITRSRNCDNPAPIDGGAPCSGQREQSQNEACAPATCAPSVFSMGLRSVSLGIGEQILFEVKFTQAPAPGIIGTWRKNGVVIEDGGKIVIASAGNSQYLYITPLDAVDSGRYSYTYNGETTEAQLTVGSGPVDGNWGTWSQWSGPPCPATCGPTARRNVERIRSCNNPAPSSGGASCPGENRQSEVQDCAPAVCVTTWNNWGQWIDPGCPRTCGVGVTRTVTRSRTCNQQPGQPFCSGTSEGSEVRACSLPLCPVSTWNNWGQWIDPGCPRTCGVGVTRTATRRRTCSQQPGQPFCSGPTEESEARTCNLPLCQVSTWNNWGQWIDPGCPRTCGVGVTRTATRRRTCNQQPGQPFCSGPSDESEVRACILPLCPVNGNWGEWTQWSGPPCSVTCGPTATRTITRSRSCNNPPPNNGGAFCPGQGTVNNELSCGPSICDSVTSTWNNWGQWIDPGCPRSCGAGDTRIAIRRRTCNQQPGQPFCSGSNEVSEIRVCELPLCPVNGNWGEWTQWSGPPCSVTCGPTAIRTITRSRLCNNPPPSNGGASCPGQGTVTNELSCGPSICEQSSWNNWGQWIDPGCPRTCGVGVTRTATRRRTCNQQPGQPFCSGFTEESEVRACSLPLCPVSTWNNWGQWIDPGCPRTCGAGVTRTATRRRTCNQQPGQPFCSGPTEESEVRACSLPLCPVNGNWGEWSQWSGLPCSVTCGPTARRNISRSRSCNNPPPSSGGVFCSGQGSMTESISCGPSFCANVTINGGYSQWSTWSTGQCSVPCGDGVKTDTRTRSCTEPTPQNGGLPCSGPSAENRTAPCNVACQVSQWSSWTGPLCPATCGRHVRVVQERSRTCTVLNPSGSDNTCGISRLERRNFTCIDVLCPVDGGFSPWSVWVTYNYCTGTCEAEVKTLIRTRSCNNPTPAFNGGPCRGDTLQTKQEVCVASPDCTGSGINGNWTEWTEWRGPSCPATCGPMARHTLARDRYCTNPPPSDGGAPCIGDSTQNQTRDCGVAAVCERPVVWADWGRWVDPGCPVTCGVG
ncbi:SCO-spondin-like isoform X16 [Haliotis rubra]|uniref:SCO-spondin-like isoform X16 n=1 Tax=Haliotis rubra TaxID=36100 RepID=UPI001EE51EDE|nr:SCO-spondin-like isoform X16 [Haliotis rubra]